MGISIWQLVIVLVIIVLIFGTKKLRNMGSDLGGALKSFKSAINENDQETTSTEDSKEGRVIEGMSEREEETVIKEQVKEKAKK